MQDVPPVRTEVYTQRKLSWAHPLLQKALACVGRCENALRSPQVATPTTQQPTVVALRAPQAATPITQQLTAAALSTQPLHDMLRIALHENPM
eukprot:2815408-Pleurochrysis_carterae.AAC.2